jgi:hypothetical protein
MHPPHVRERALELMAAGHNDCQVARIMGIPRPTIRDWRRPTYVPRIPRVRELCPRCWRAAKPIRFSSDDYCELLGIYLGDGCISAAPRTWRLRIALDQRYPAMIGETEALLARSFPANRVDVVRNGLKGDCVNLSVYSTHLPCLFPQHGPGKKHERPIALEVWQLDLVKLAPWAFLRGCIRSDGCVFINRTGPYEYLSYGFANKSGDIIRLFVMACELVGVKRRVRFNARRGLWDIRINRRDSVEQMMANVGLKS